MSQLDYIQAKLDYIIERLEFIFPPDDWENRYLDDYDTQEQIEEYYEGCDACPEFYGDEICFGCEYYKDSFPNEYCPDKLEPVVTKVTLWNDDKTEFVTIAFPDEESALRFTQGL